MSININHPSFITFLENITKVILSEIDIKNYFNILPEKRMKIQKETLAILKKNMKTRALVTDTEVKGFVVVLKKKNEENENYEVSAILRDIILNFDIINPPVEKKNVNTTKVNT